MKRICGDKKRSVMQHYNNLAKVYESLYETEQHAKIKLALRLVKIKKSECVLDVGCGTGFL
ncbi:unnamed protein product, partial [marine sediment metagenome]